MAPKKKDEYECETLGKCISYKCIGMFGGGIGPWRIMKMEKAEKVRMFCCSFGETKQELKKKKKIDASQTKNLNYPESSEKEASALRAFA